MIKNISIETLRSFVTIAELGSFTLAGNKLSRSQSAISLQIKKLEDLLGQQLFDRSGHKFELTASGDILINYARQILQLNDRAIGELNSKLIVGKVRLGIPSEFATTLLPKIVGNFSRKNPKITLEAVCDLSRNLIADLKQNKYDLILYLLDNKLSPKGQFIKKDPLAWVARKGYQLDKNKPVPLIVAPEGCIYRHRAIEQLNQAHIPWQIIYTIMDLSGIKAAIEEGLGITVLAQSTVPDSLDIIPAPGTKIDLGNIGITLLSPEKKMSEATQALAEHIHESLQ